MSTEDSYVRHSIFVQRFSGSEARKAEKILMGITATIHARLLREPTEFQTGRLLNLRNDINFILRTEFQEFNHGQMEMLFEFAESEAEFAEKALQAETGVILSTPAPVQIQQAVFNQGMDVPIGPSKITINQALTQFAGRKSQQINTIINDGILLGDTTEQIANQVTEFMGAAPRHQVNTLTRTTINNASNQAHRAFHKQNSDILQGEEYVATLDSRTSLICAGRDGIIYPIDRGPGIPAHYNCRSVYVPVLKDEFDLNDDTATRASKGAEGGKQVAAKTKFDGWLRKQPAGFQDEYFDQFPDGAEKAKLFRLGKLPIQQFRSETGVNFTLEQLQAMHPVEFEKANIDVI